MNQLPLIYEGDGYLLNRSDSGAPTTVLRFAENKNVTPTESPWDQQEPEVKRRFERAIRRLDRPSRR